MEQMSEERLAEALAVLGDIAEGGDKAAALYLRLDAERAALWVLKADLMEALRRAEVGDDRGCVGCGDYSGDESHTRLTTETTECLIGRLLRALGGEEKAARQRDVAEEQARQEHAARAQPPVVATSALTFTTVAMGFTPGTNVVTVLP